MSLQKSLRHFSVAEFAIDFRRVNVGQVKLQRTTTLKSFLAIRTFMDLNFWKYNKYFNDNLIKYHALKVKKIVNKPHKLFNISETLNKFAQKNTDRTFSTIAHLWLNVQLAKHFYVSISLNSTNFKL
jgi:hypothetical protein